MAERRSEQLLGRSSSGRMSRVEPQVEMAMEMVAESLRESKELTRDGR